MRQQAGEEVRALWRVRGVQQLSGLQVRQAENDRRQVPELLARRDYRAALEARQNLLRLQPLSGVRFRGLGQTDPGKMPGMRRELPDREIPQGWTICAMPQSGVQIQEGASRAGGRPGSPG